MDGSCRPEITLYFLHTKEERNYYTGIQRKQITNFKSRLDLPNTEADYRQICQEVFHNSF